MNALNRLTQKAGESLLHTEKTHYPLQTDELINQVDKLKPWLTQLISTCEAFIDVTTATKITDSFSMHKEKITTTDRLGTAMGTVGEECKSCAANLGRVLSESSKAHVCMGTARKTFIESLLQNYVEVLRNFLNIDVAKAQSAKSHLEMARLDLDSHKNKLKKMKTDELRATEQIEVNKFDAEYNRVLAESDAIMKQVLSDFDRLSPYVTTLVTAEKVYYEACLAECNKLLELL